jgi:hypothetical protein
VGRAVLKVVLVSLCSFFLVFVARSGEPGEPVRRQTDAMPERIMAQEIVAFVEGAGETTHGSASRLR